MRMTRRKWIITAAVLALVAGIAVPAVILLRYRPLAETAAGYMARVACGCVFIGGRSLDSCMADKEAGMERVQVTVDTERRRVVANVPLLASAAAIHIPGAGCRMDR